MRMGQTLRYSSSKDPGPLTVGGLPNFWHETVAPDGRLLAGAAARALGRGGGARMARLAGLSRPTVYTGVRELDEPPDPRGRVRRPGGGPRRLVERDPGLLDALEELVDPDTRGPSEPVAVDLQVHPRVG